MRFYLGVVLFIGLAISCLAQSEEQNFKNQTLADSMHIEAVVVRADSLKMLGKLEESFRLLNEVDELAESGGSPYLIQLVKLQLVENYLGVDQFSNAEEILKNVLQRFPDTPQKANCLSLLGVAYNGRGQYKEALLKQEEAKALVDSAENPRIYSQIQLNIATIYESTANLASAFNYFLESIKISESIGDSALLATGLNNLGLAYNNYSKPEKAKYYLQKALLVNEKINDRVGLLKATNNLAITEWQLGNLEKAITTYARALALHKEVRKHTPPFRILYNLGQVYKDQGSLDEAENYYKQSLNYCQEAGISQGLIYNYGGLANVEQLRGNLAASHTYYSKALKVAKQINAKNLQKIALNSLYDLEKERANFRNALSYYEQYVALTDSLNDEARKQELKKVETELGLRKQQEINTLLRDKQQQQEVRLSTQKWVIVLGVAIIIIILISLFVVYRSNTEKQRINNELEHQRNQLQGLNRVKNKMMAIIAHDLRSPLASMHGMLFLIREQNLSQQEMQKMAAKLEVSLDQNISMMDNLLAWAGEQMSGLEIDTTPVRAYDVVSEVLQSYQFHASHKGITLKNEVAEDAEVMADLNLFKLILRNLITNGIKFSNDGDKITIKSSSEPGQIVFEVKDTGIGIPKEIQQKIFSVTGKSRTGTQDEKGSGLGLTLCKEFVEKQQGTIRLESTEGEGTSFIFSLPTAHS